MKMIFQGFLAGTVAGIIKNGLDLITFYGLHFHRYRYVDHASGVFYNHTPNSTVEFLFILLVDIWFSAFWGVIFFLIITRLKGDTYLFLGWIYGSGLWFFIHALGSVLRVPTFANMMISTLIFHLITDSIYGLTLAIFYGKYMERAKG